MLTDRTPPNSRAATSALTPMAARRTLNPARLQRVDMTSIAPTFETDQQWSDAPALSRMGLAALTLSQEHGLPVFPVYEPRGNGACSCGSSHADSPKNIAKHPRIDGGFKSASTHPEQIAEWWDRWPDANVGVWPGPARLLVLDIDGPEGIALAESMGANVPTLETITRRGVHKWFRLPLGVTIANSARSQLDIRAHHGYVLAPPSVHASGFVYEWRGSMDAIADVPPRLLTALLPPPPASLPIPARRSTHFDSLTERRVIAYCDRLGYGLGDGRKTGAFRFAAFLAHDVGLPEPIALGFLEDWNSGNAPPLPSRIIHEIHANARKYGGRRGAA